MNQKKLDTETKILHANVTHFAKQTTQWLKLVEDFNQALKVSQSLVVHCHSDLDVVYACPL